MKRFQVVLALLPLVLITGCVTRAVREKQAQLCGDLAALNSAIAGVRRASNTSQATVETLKQAEGRVTAAFREFKASAQDVPDAKMDDLETAYEDLDKTIKELPNQSTIGQAKVFLTNKVTTVESAVTKTKSGLRCPS